MIAAGYEDGNDTNRLRSDPVFKMAQVYGEAKPNARCSLDSSLTSSPAAASACSTSSTT
ncbi:hypothetical protein X734_33145 [Mesorhizobium sp. L2C084A000]|nr:hypothetical protein X734_33145 [Mesorhizobium sp. L2C084A000]